MKFPVRFFSQDILLFLLSGLPLVPTIFSTKNAKKVEYRPHGKESTEPQIQHYKTHVIRLHITYRTNKSKLEKHR